MNITLDDEMVTYEDGTSETVDEFARRVLTGELLEHAERERKLREALSTLLDAMETPRSNKATAAWDLARATLRYSAAED